MRKTISMEEDLHIRLDQKRSYYGLKTYSELLNYLLIKERLVEHLIRTYSWSKKDFKNNIKNIQLIIKHDAEDLWSLSLTEQQVEDLIKIIN